MPSRRKHTITDEDIIVTPRDTQLEYYVAGRIATYNEPIREVGMFLTEQCFTDLFCREIYKTVVDMESKGQEINPFDVRDVLRKKDIEFDDDTFLNITMFRNTYELDRMAIKLSELATRRKLKNTSIAMGELMEDETTDLDSVYAHLRELGEERQTPIPFTTIQGAGQKVLQRMVDNATYDKPIGTPTGFSQIDSLGGLHKGDLVIVAGDTSNGKTSFALSITYNAIIRGKSIAYYSLEMSDEELMARLLAIPSNVPASTQLYKRAVEDDYNSVCKAYAALKRYQLYFDDRATVNFDSILASIRAMKHNADIDGAVVDYLQILNVNNKGRETQEQLMAQVARKLKNLAKELGIWIIALSQLNRNSQSPEPTLARLRDSGQIAEAADVVILVYRPELYKKPYAGDFSDRTTRGTAQIDIAKGRNIGLTKFLLRFNPALTYFYEGYIGKAGEDEWNDQQQASTDINIDSITGDTANEKLPF